MQWTQAPGVQLVDVGTSIYEKMDDLIMTRSSSHVQWSRPIEITLQGFVTTIRKQSFHTISGSR